MKVNGTHKVQYDGTDADEEVHAPGYPELAAHEKDAISLHSRRRLVW